MRMTTTAGASAPPSRFTGADVSIGLIVLGILCLALFPVELHRAFGLPAHPLILHVPVVLVPILGLTLLFAALRPHFFERNALAIGAFTVITLAATILTAGAGEAFRSDRGGGPPDEAQRLSEHAESGDWLRLVMLGVAALVLFAVALTQARAGNRLGFLSGLASSRGVRLALRGLFVAGAVIAIFFVIRTGHLGAQVTWERDSEGGPRSGFNPPGGGAPNRGDPDGDQASPGGP
jgi:hypothetical protein